MRQLRMPRLDPIVPEPNIWQRKGPGVVLPPCGHPHPHLDHVACVLDRGHRADLHAHPTKQAVYRW